MTDRSVTVRYKADTSDLTTKSAAAGVSIQSAFTGAQSAGQSLQQTTHNVGLGFLALGGIATAGVGAAIGSFASFDQQMSHIQAATHESAAGMGILTDATLAAGQASQYSATQAGQGVEELAKAGVKTADIVGGALTGSLNLAAAGGLAVADSATTMATAMSVFNIAGDKASHVADLLAAGAGKAQGSVSDMAMALNQSALVANQVGLSVEDTTGALAEFANAGLIGSDAGTSFRTALLKLINPSIEAQGVMSQLGISVYDNQGRFAGLESIAGQLQERLGGVDEATRNAALSTIFGSDAIRAASVLYEDGASGVEQWRNSVDDAGYAAETARLMTDNLSGDVERLGGAWETAMIKIGSGADGPLRSGTQLLTNMIDVIGSAPPAVQQTVLVVGGLTAAIGLSGGAAILAAPKIIAYRSAIDSLRNADTATTATRGLATVLSGLGRALPIVGVALTVGVGLVAAYAEAHHKAAVPVEDFTATLDAETGALTDNTHEWAKNHLATTGALDAFTKIGISADVAADAYLQSASALGVVDAAMQKANGPMADAQVLLGNQGTSAEQVAAEWAYFSGEVGGAAAAVNTVSDALGQGKSLLDGYEASTGAAAKRFSDAADAVRLARPEIAGLGADYSTVATKAGDASDAAVTASSKTADQIETERQTVLDLIDAYDKLHDINKTAPEALGAYHQSIRDTARLIGELTDAQDKNGDSVDTSNMSIADIIKTYGGLSGVLNKTKTDFDVTTEQGYKLRQSFDDIGDSAEESAKSAYDLAIQMAKGDPAKLSQANRDYVKALQDSRAEMSLELQALGLSKDAADALATSIIGIPDSSTTQIKVEDEVAKQKVQEQETRLHNLEVTRTTKLVADPGGVISGVTEAQRYIDGLHGRTIYIPLQWQGPGPLQGLADGGYVPPRDGGSIRVLGEGGEGEYVVPESQKAEYARMWGYGAGGAYDPAVVQAASAPAPMITPAQSGPTGPSMDEWKDMLARMQTPLIGQISVSNPQAETTSEMIKTASEMASSLFGFRAA